MAEAVQKPNLLVRLIGAVWGTFNFVRRLVFGVIALFLLIAILSGLAGEVPRLEDKTALVIAPRGARLPRSTTMPPLAVRPPSIGRMTSGFQFGAAAMPSHTLRPVTVSASRWSLPCSPRVRITAGRPPA